MQSNFDVVTGLETCHVNHTFVWQNVSVMILMRRKIEGRSHKSCELVKRRRFALQSGYNDKLVFRILLS